MHFENDNHTLHDDEKSKYPPSEDSLLQVQSVKLRKPKDVDPIDHVYQSDE